MINIPISLLAGLVASLSFKPFALWPFALIGLGVWYQLICVQNFKKRLQSSYFFGLGILLPTQAWTGIYVGDVPWLVLCFGQALIFTFPSFFVGKGKTFNQITFICSYMLVEVILRTFPFTGFGWTRLGFSQINSPLIIIYPVLGVAGVALFLSWYSTIRSFKSFLLPTSILIVAAFIPNPVVFDGSIKLALVQGGVVKLGLDFNDKPREVFLRHVIQTQKSISPNQVDLIVWPENAVDVDVFKNADVMQTISDLSKELATPILIGGVTNPSNPRNQSMLFDPQLKQIYTKRYLTPFGEYVPLRSLAEKLSPYAQQVNDFDAGSNSIVFEIDKYQFHTLICYELLNDKFVSENDRDFLVIQTNNATFGDTAQLDQQLNIAQIRAAESSRHLAYVSTTGTTAFINSSGHIESKLIKFQPGTLIGEIDISSGSSYAQELNRYLEPLAMIVLLVFLMLRRWARA